MTKNKFANVLWIDSILILLSFRNQINISIDWKWVSGGKTLLKSPARGPAAHANFSDRVGHTWLMHTVFIVYFCKSYMHVLYIFVAFIEFLMKQFWCSREGMQADDARSGWGDLWSGPIWNWKRTDPCSASLPLEIVVLLFHILALGWTGRSMSILYIWSLKQ